MIIVRISGGLGNQMFQYAVAKAMASKKNDSFKMDLSFYTKQTFRRYELGHFNIEENIASEKECKRLRGSEGIILKIKKRLGIADVKPGSYHADSMLSHRAERTEQIFREDILRLTGDVYLDGYWQSEKYFKDTRTEINKDFTPKYGINGVVKRYLGAIQATNSVGLHVRRGDYVDNNPRIGSGLNLTKISYYLQAIKYISDRVETPVYYIFSDDLSWCKANFNCLEHKVFVEETNSAIDDMVLMKNCKHNIIANSTFSWWGAWLNANDAKIIIAPKIWYKTNHRLHLAPAEWVRL